MRMKPMMLITLCLLLWTTTAAVASGHGHALKVGKKGEITLKQPTKVADKVLQPDTYVVQHRSSGDDHFVRFVELKQVEVSNAESKFTYTEADTAGEIKCQVEPTSAATEETMVYFAPKNGEARITKVAIKGEKFVHVF